MKIDVITLFPDMFNALNYGIVGRAQPTLLTLHYWNPRDFTQDKHGRVDDSPYGGGPGMVMQVQPLRAAIQSARAAHPPATPVIYLSPQGRALKQTDMQRFSQCKDLILLTGRYEGIDQRLIDHDIDEEWSIGDYVLSGGELAAMVMIDAIVRLLPEALGDAESAQQDSFSEGLLDYPHYTRPALIDHQAVPEILSSGNHAAIADWRLQQSLGNTWLKRPDLLAARKLSEKEKQLLANFIAQQ